MRLYVAAPRGYNIGFPSSKERTPMYCIRVLETSGCR